MNYKLKVRAASNIKLSPRIISALEKAIIIVSSKPQTLRQGYTYKYLGATDDHSVDIAFSCKNAISVTRAVASSLTRVLVDKEHNLLSDTEIQQLRYNKNILKAVIEQSKNEEEQLENMLPTEVIAEMVSIFFGPGCKSQRAVEFQENIKQMVINYRSSNGK